MSISIQKDIASFVFVIAFASTEVSAQTATELPLQLNGVLYELVKGDEGQKIASFLWSLELEDLSSDYNKIELSQQRKRANTLFFAETTGRDWREFWSQRMQTVYVEDSSLVNDNAEAFFTISSSFPDVFKAGDEFSLEKSGDGATRAYLNDELIAKSFKPDHFEFWLKAWYTGADMPDAFTGNLLAGGYISDELNTAYLNSAPPIVKALAVEQPIESTQESADKLIDESTNDSEEQNPTVDKQSVVLEEDASEVAIDQEQSSEVETADEPEEVSAADTNSEQPTSTPWWRIWRSGN